MQTELGRDGAYLDRIYYCPHHPDIGFEGEVKALKVNCNCRKPAIGMIERAAQDLNADLSASWMIGDSTADILAANQVAVILHEPHSLPAAEDDAVDQPYKTGAQLQKAGVLFTICTQYGYGSYNLACKRSGVG